MTDNLPEVVHHTPAALEVPVAEFEGETVRRMVGKVKVPDLDMPVGYKRGTHLKLEIEVRVRDVFYREVGSAGAKELVREHTLVVEDSAIKLIGAYTSEQLDPGVGGSAAALGGDLEHDNEDDENLDGHSDITGDAPLQSMEDKDDADPGF